jgi:phage protein D
VDFPTLPSLTVQPRRVDLIEGQRLHDILKMEYSAESPLWFDTIRTGVPVKFSWQQDTLGRAFIGYVSNISKIDAPQRQTSMVITCVGATYPLKQRVTKVFKNITIPQAVQQIVEEFDFNFVTEPHPQVFDQLIIPGNSYWEWIQEQAKRIGYGVVVDRMNFIFKPLDRLIDMNFSNAPVLSIGDKTAPFNTQFLDRTLDYFKVINGDNVEDSYEYRAVKKVGGVDPITAAPFVADQSPEDVGRNLRSEVSDVLFDEYRTERVVNDRSDAATVAASAAQLARFNIPARVDCQGDPRIRPFSTVFINGTGSLTDGFWVVREAHHMFHKVGDYQMNLTVATDGLGESTRSGFRTRGLILSGTINLTEAIADSPSEIVQLDSGSAYLQVSPMAVKESDQGFKKNPARWKAAV